MTRALRFAARETRGLFESPGGYIIVGTFWLVAGLLLTTGLFGFRAASLQLAQSGRIEAQPMGLHINDMVIRPLLYNLGSILIFFVPLLTMKSFAEERRTGSLELLLSLPARGGDVLLGKFLGALGSLSVCLSVLLVHGLVLLVASRPDWSAALAGVIGLFLMGVLFTSVGLLLSVLSHSQVEAAVLSLGLLLVLVIGPDTFQPTAPWQESLVESISILARFEDFTRGILDLGHVAFFLGATLVVLAIALRALDLVRWQG